MSQAAQLVPMDGTRRKLEGELAAVLRRAAQLDRVAAHEGLVATRHFGVLANGHTVLVMAFSQRPVPRRWWHDWRSVAAVSVCALLGVLGCAYAVYRAAVTALGALVAVFPVLVVAAAVVGLIWLATSGGGGRTFSGTFKGKIN